jgi:hypothetical protein
VIPLLASEWHPIKNGDLSPSQVLCGGNTRKYWWICRFGHEWQSSIGRRIVGKEYRHGCPVCAHHKITLDDGTVCDSYVEAYIYLKYKDGGINFVHHGSYGGRMGRKAFDFYLPDTKTFVEVTGFDSDWRHWKKYLRGISMKRRYVRSIGCRFRFIRIPCLEEDQLTMVRDHLAPSQTRKYRPYDEAKRFAISLGLKSIMEWKGYWQSGKCPTDIPRFPQKEYRGKGWNGYGEWLGTGRKSPRGRTFRPFLDARRFVRLLGLKNRKEWHCWAKSDKRPLDIPYEPREVYLGKGWAGVEDWLGTKK